MCFVVPFLHLHPPNPPTLVKNNGKNKLFFILAHIWHWPPENGYALQGNVWRMCMWKKIKGKKGENSNLGRGLAATPFHGTGRGDVHPNGAQGTAQWWEVPQVTPSRCHPSPQWIPSPSQVARNVKPGPKMRILFPGQKVQDDTPTISYSPFQRGTAVLSVQWAFLQQQVLLMLIHGWILRSYITDLNSKIKLLLKNTVY